MSVFPSRETRLRPRHWPAIGAAGAALLFLPAWSQAAMQVSHGAARVRIAAPVAMSFDASSLYLALALGLLVCAAFGALAGGAAAAVASLPSRRN